MFEFFKQELASLRAAQSANQIVLWYYDETGFSLNPNAVYAWLPKNAKSELPAQRGNVLTIAGFFQSDNTLQAYSHQGSMSSEPRRRTAIYSICGGFSQAVSTN